MDTKNKIADQVLLRLGGGNITDRWDRRDILFTICQVRDALAKAAYYDSLNQGFNDINPVWLSVFEDQAVLHDINKGLYYSTLPAKAIQLPLNRGLHSVSLMKDIYNPFIPITNGAAVLLKDHDTGEIDLLGSYGFFPEGDKVYYLNFNNTSATVLIKIVADAQSLGNDDFFPCAPDAYKVIVDSTYNAYVAPSQKPIDITDNKIPT